MKVGSFGSWLTWLFGGLCAIVTSLFGGWSHGLTVLCIFMLIDFVTGFVSALMNKSDKSSSGGLSSKVIWVGIIKKVMTLVIVVVGAQLDTLTGASYIRDTVVIGYIITETISIIENAGLIGLPIPPIIKRVIDVLKAKNDNIEPKV